MLSLLRSAVEGVVNNVAQAAQQVQTVEFDDRTVQIKEQLGEGGFAYVYSVVDVTSGETLAMKKMVCQDREAREVAETEIKVMRQLRGHPHIIKYISSCKRENTSTSTRCIDYYILMELCTGGSLIDLIQRRDGRKLPESALADLFYQICQAVSHMHTQSPPLAHRDLKIENLLLDERGRVKLCDFGSCRDRAQRFVTMKEIVEEEEKISKYSTQMYRAPEMTDLYKKEVVSEKVDIWALGCILFTLAFFTHPFQDAGNLAILSGKYDVPEEHPFSIYVTALIKRMLITDSMKRPDIKIVIQMVEQWREAIKRGDIKKKGKAAALTIAAASSSTESTSSAAAAAAVPPIGFSISDSSAHRHHASDDSSIRPQSRHQGGLSIPATSRAVSSPQTADPRKPKQQLPKSETKLSEKKQKKKKKSNNNKQPQTLFPAAQRPTQQAQGFADGDWAADFSFAPNPPPTAAQSPSTRNNNDSSTDDSSDSSDSDSDSNSNQKPTTSMSASSSFATPHRFARSSHTPALKRTHSATAVLFDVDMIGGDSSTTPSTKPKPRPSPSLSSASSPFDAATAQPDWQPSFDDPLNSQPSRQPSFVSTDDSWDAFALANNASPYPTGASSTSTDFDAAFSFDFSGSSNNSNNFSGQPAASPVSPPRASTSRSGSAAVSPCSANHSSTASSSARQHRHRHRHHDKSNEVIDVSKLSISRQHSRNHPSQTPQSIRSRSLRSNQGASASSSSSSSSSDSSDSDSDNDNNRPSATNTPRIGKINLKQAKLKRTL